MTPEQLLEFERAHQGDTAGRRADAARRELGVTLPAFYQMLRTALGTRAALEHDAALTRHITDRWAAASRRRRDLIFGRRRPR